MDTFTLLPFLDRQFFLSLVCMVSLGQPLAVDMSVEPGEVESGHQRILYRRGLEGEKS